MTGALLGRADRPILMHQPRPNHAEHSSDDIWQAVCGAAREARENAGADPRAIAGLAKEPISALFRLDHVRVYAQLEANGNLATDTALLDNLQGEGGDPPDMKIDYKKELGDTSS